MTTLVTGTAGFIGAALAMKLLERGDQVIGLDNFNDYYDVQLKRDRTARLSQHENFTSLEANLEDRLQLENAFKQYKPCKVVNLAAQAGVRHSLEAPQEYIDANITGFLNVLECCRQYPVEHLVYASSSSVYGASTQMPFSVHSNADHPVSLYAASKKSNELMAHSYSHLFRIPTTGLRFFTVYGPWGRPDMASCIFTRKMLAGEPIDIFNHGHHRRDFTYIDDITEGVVRSLDRPPAPDPNWNSAEPDPGSSSAPYRLYNIGSNRPIALMDFIETLEQCLGITAKKNLLPMQAGDVAETYADVSSLSKYVDYKPSTSLQEGLSQFVDWYRSYYQA